MSMFKSKLIKFFLPVIAICILAFANGCNQDAVTPTQADNLEFSYMSSGDSVGGDIGILVLDEVKLLIKDIKLNVANSAEDSTNFKVGPYVLYLNMISNINFISTGFIPEGTYDKVRFQVHKLENSEPVPDPDFEDVNGRYSVVVKGRYAGISFVFKSDKSAHQKITFPGNLHSSLTGRSNITLHVKPYIWFIKNGIYLDPRDPANLNDIENNIKTNINANFKIFVDNDKNGQPD